MELILKRQPTESRLNVFSGVVGLYRINYVSGKGYFAFSIKYEGDTWAELNGTVMYASPLLRNQKVCFDGLKTKTGEFLQLEIEKIKVNN